MSSAFRYSGQKYNDALLALGNVRVGTLHDFRRIEHKRGVSDPREGTKSVSHYISSVTDKDVGSTNLDALKKFEIFDVSDCKDWAINNIHISREFEYPDCFVHCVSVEYSMDVLGQFEGADSCVEITDLIGFYNRLTKTLNSHVPVELEAVSTVRYMLRKEEWNSRDWGEHPALMKEPEFSGQVELRAIWRPKFSGEISPILLNDIGLIDFCKRRELPTARSLRTRRST